MKLRINRKEKKSPSFTEQQEENEAMKIVTEEVDPKVTPKLKVKDQEVVEVTDEERIKTARELMSKNLELFNQKRFLSIDVMRGFFIFVLTMLGPIILATRGVIPLPDFVYSQFAHVEWQGFSFWDLLMPMFLFISGATIPFSFDKYKSNTSFLTLEHAYVRIGRRFIALWILGCIAQGNLLSFDLGQIKVFSNVLQAIAIGYLFASLFYLLLDWKIQIAICTLLLLSFTFIMFFVTIGDHGGTWEQTSNISYYIDSIILGRFRDAAHINQNGNLVQNTYYQYTWILSSLNFTASVMMGVFASLLLRSQKLSDKSCTCWLLGLGLVMVVLGWTLDFYNIPVIKPIWSSSMVLVATGYCFVLLGILYFVIDCLGNEKCFSWLDTIGKNSLLIYLISTVIGQNRLVFLFDSLFYGLKRFINEGMYNLILVLFVSIFLYFICWVLNRARLFFRV